MLSVDAAAMLAASLFFVAFAHGGSGRPAWLLWAGALTLAAGFASSLPCAITMPAEAGVAITPGRLLAMNLAGSAGESLAPFAFGAAFEAGWYSAFGPAFAVLNIVVLGATAVARAGPCSRAAGCIGRGWCVSSRFDRGRESPASGVGGAGAAVSSTRGEKGCGSDVSVQHVVHQTHVELRRGRAELFAAARGCGCRSGRRSG